MVMVAMNPATVTTSSNLLQGRLAFSTTTIVAHFNIPGLTRIRGCNPIHMSSCSTICNSNRISTTKDFKLQGPLKFQFKNLGLRSVRVSNDGGGGKTGGGGGSGNSGGGSNSSDDGDGQNWTLLSWYLSLLAKYPVITKGVTSAFLNLIGDLVCQLMIDRVPSLDLKRTLIFTLLGLVLVGPTLHFWYLYLSKLVTNPGVYGAFSRLLLDQFIFAPIFVGVFLSAVLTLEGRPSQIAPKLKQEWFSSVVVNWQLWIPFQFLNFRFVPQQFQVLAANFVALIWNVILSYKAHKEVLAK